MKWLLLLLPLAVNAGQVQLDFQGTPPFRLTAERFVSCKPVSVFDFNTENKREIVTVNFSACTSYKVCNEAGCAEISRQKIYNGAVVVCKPVVCK
jgi:hypothetical protein